jgi:hypothetical protein
VGLEATVAELAAGVDELEVDLLQRALLGVHQQRLPTGAQKEGLTRGKQNL